MILVIGYGNCLRRDDGAGPALARMIGEKCVDGSIRVIEVHQLAPELADDMASPDVTAVIFMDSRLGRDPDKNGKSLQMVELESLRAEYAHPSLGHHCDPRLLLAYTELLHGGHPPAWLVSIPGEDFGYGEGLSGSARALLAAAQKQVSEFISRIRNRAY